MQLINLTVYKKNGVLTSQNIAVDVDDLATTIRFNSNSKSYFSLLSKSPIHQKNALSDDYEVDETMSAIKALSPSLLLLTVTARNNFTVTTETMVFNASHVVGAYLTVGGGTEFLYAEYGDPSPVKYLVTESIATIMSQQVVTASVQESFVVPCSDETTAITTGTAKVTFPMPYAFTLTKVKGSLTTASAGGGTIFTVDVNKNGTTIFSTKLTIDATETTSETATTPNVLAITSFANDDVITIDVDSINGGGATGLKIELIGNQ